VLSNEEVYDGKSEQGYDVIRKPMRQVIMRITAYAERLLEGLAGLDWPEGIKELQRNWIGRTTGVEIEFPVVGGPGSFRAFTTRPETLAGVTFLVIAPEHPEAGKVVAPERREEVERYREAARNKSDLSRTKGGGEKTGVPTGRFVLNPLTGQQVPIFVADYVLAEHGTGVVMGVPAHDERDFEFAQKYGVPVVPVIAPAEEPARTEVLRGRRCWIEEGAMLDVLPPRHAAAYAPGMSVEQGREAISRYLEAQGLGKITVHYRIRDWVFARQRYWGEPIPLIHWEDGTVTALKPEELPLELPHVEDFKPTGDGQSALARAREWVEVTDPATGNKGQRETSTMPQWAGSCWYPLRFIDPHNDRQLVDPEKERAWGPVDLYIGGAEHATLHLLYARFWYLALHDLGLIVTEEPFKKLVNQGMLVSYAYENERGVVLPIDEVEEVAEGQYVHKKTGERVQRIVAKMSKTLRNVVNPDDVIERFGSDTFRTHLMFMGPVEVGRVWETEQVGSTFRFLRRVWALVTGNSAEGLRETVPPEREDESVKVAVNTLIQNITEDMEGLRLNTAVAELMKFVNAVEGQPVARDTLEKFVKVLSPLAPYLAEELWRRAGHEGTIAYEPWPEVDRAVLDAARRTIEVVIQVQGRKRDVIAVPAGATDADLQAAVREQLGRRGRYALPDDARMIVVRDKQSGHPRLVNVLGAQVKS
jgi:leucyl-tRNA synthetase